MSSVGPKISGAQARDRVGPKMSGALAWQFSLSPVGPQFSLSSVGPKINGEQDRDRASALSRSGNITSTCPFHARMPEMARFCKKELRALRRF